MKKTFLPIAMAVSAMLAFSACDKKHQPSPTSSKQVVFDHCTDHGAVPTKGSGYAKGTGNFVALGPFNGIGHPYYHGLSGSTFPLTPVPTPGGDNIIRNGASRRPLTNVTGIATDIATSTVYVLAEKTGSPGSWQVWKFAVGDPNNAGLVFNVVGGGASLSDLEFDYNFSASPGSKRFLALDRTKQALIEINLSGTVVMSTGWYTSTFPLPASEVVTGLAWFNCQPVPPMMHSHPFLLSHDASGTGHMWKCTDNTLENGWSAPGAEYTFGNNPSSPMAEFGTYFDHSATLHFVIANDANENTETIPAGGPNTPYNTPFIPSTDPIIDMAEL